MRRPPGQVVAFPDGSREPFEVDPFRKECLVEGIDEIDLTMRHVDQITAYEQRSRAENPWLTPSR